MKVVYLVGIPGAGKTTALARAIELVGWAAVDAVEKPVHHVVYDSGAVQIGRVRPPFGGTDALSMSVGPTACRWIANVPALTVVGEGDRLAYPGFLDAAAGAGTLDLVWLDVAPSVARERAVARTGTEQNPSWVKGRIAKIDNLVAKRAHHRIDAGAEPETVAAAVAAFL